MSRTAADILTVRVAFTIRKRGGRKVMVMPDGAKPERPQVDNTLVKALARAFRWKRMLEAGAFATVSDLAAHEKIAPTYMTRVMRLTLLAPQIIESVLDERFEVGLVHLLEPFPADWALQLNKFSPVNRGNSRGS